MTTVDIVEAERPALTGLAFRMLGTMDDAREAVQETYLHWYRLGAAERNEIRNPAAWLTRAASRICLDVLGSARRRRERYVGPWLPEPLPSGALSAPPVDPAERAALDDSISTALLVVLETMTPAERVAFVLHDVFGVPFDEIARIVDRSPAASRQLASSARRHLADRRSRPVSREEHDAVVRDFAAACLGGDLGALTAVLDPDVALRSDGGGIVSAARNPVLGSDRVARFVLGVMAKWRDYYREGESADGMCLVAEDGGEVRSVINIGVREGKVVEVWTMLNPDKLGAWR